MALAYTTTTTPAFTDSQYGSAVASTALKTLVNQVVDKRYHKQVQKKNFFSVRGMIGEDMYSEGDFSETKAGYPVLRKTQLQSDSGDVIKMGQRRNLTSDYASGGVVLNAQLVDNESAYDFYSLKVSIERWREAVRGFGGMSRQRNPYGESIEGIQEGLLADWAASQQDTAILYALWAGFAPHIFRAWGTTSCDPSPNANTLIGNDDTLDTTRAITALVGDGSDDLKGLTFEIGSAYMEQNDFDPVMVNGQPYFVVLISPRGRLKLQQDANFRNAQQYARERGLDNPLFKFAEFVYSNCIIFSYDKIRSILNGYNPNGLTVGSNQITEAAYTGIGGGVSASSLHQTMFLGANAVALAEGAVKMVGRKEDDYGNFIGTGVDMIFGTRRADFASEAGTIANQSGLVIVNSLT